MPRPSHIFFLLLNTLIITATNPESQPPSMDTPRLPPPQQEGTKVDLSNGQASLGDQLGPLVINKDGTTSRITNWQKMNEREKETTMRIVTKRNRARLEALKEAQNNKKGEL